jgi:molybdate-binding protein/DNA-binding XRE family transcriptional regulator
MGRRTDNDGIENHVRELRVNRNLTQVQLADRAGITRQAVKSIESRQYTPNTAVTLRLASALGCRVEDIFRLEADGPELQAWTAGERAQPGDRVLAARVGDRIVAYPLVGANSLSELLVTADAVAGEDGTIKLMCPEDALSGTALLLGCDPSISVLSDRVSRASRDTRLAWLQASSVPALEAVGAGRAHIGGSHLGSGVQDGNLAEAEKVLAREGGIVVTYAAWQQGFMVAAGNPRAVRRIEDLARPGARFVNREPGSGSRRLADELLAAAGLNAADVPGYESRAPSHSAVARAVAAGLVDAGIGLELVAAAFGLDFVPLAEVRFDLVIPQRHVDHPAVRVMLEVLQSRSLRADLGALPGYDAGRTGHTILQRQAA